MSSISQNVNTAWLVYLYVGIMPSTWSNQVTKMTVIPSSSIPSNVWVAVNASSSVRKRLTTQYLQLQQILAEGAEAMMINSFLQKAVVWTILSLCTVLTLQAQISVVFPEGKKAVYTLGETVHLRVFLKSLPETCLDGMKQSKIFTSGLKIKEQTNWKQTAKAQFQKDMTLEVISNKKKTAKLTILRKVDKENLFHQEILTLLTN